MLYDCKFLLLLLFLVFPGGSDSKESTCNTGDLGSIPGLGRSPGEGKGYPLQYSWLEKPLGQRSLVDYSSWGHKQLDTTEWLSTHGVIFLMTLRQALCLILAKNNPCPRELSHTGQTYVCPMQSSLVWAMHIQDIVERSSQEGTGSASLRSSQLICVKKEALSATLSDTTLPPP